MRAYREYYGINRYLCLDHYEEVKNPAEWLNCKMCGLKPVVWRFDNGRFTACGCGENQYEHHSIQAESIMSVYRRTGKTEEYDYDELMKNWNHYVKTGVELFNKNLYPNRW